MSPSDDDAKVPISAIDEAPEEPAQSDDGPSEGDPFRGPGGRSAVAAERRRTTASRLGLEGKVYQSATWFVWVIALVLASGLVVWTWHILAPDKWRWLTLAEIQELQSYLFGGAVSAFAVSLRDKIFKADDDNEEDGG